MNAAQLIHQNSGKTEWYTPPGVVDVARATMGGIDFDPASTAAANCNVAARRYWSLERRAHRWHHPQRLTTDLHPVTRNWPRGARVWMNHPFSREENPLWIAHAVEQYESGWIEQLTLICFQSMSANWFRPLLNYPCGIFYGRINYLDALGNVVRGVTKDSVLVYLGPHVERFTYSFETVYQQGKVMKP